MRRQKIPLSEFADFANRRKGDLATGSVQQVWGSFEAGAVHLLCDRVRGREWRSKSVVPLAHPSALVSAQPCTVRSPGEQVGDRIAVHPAMILASANGVNFRDES